MSSDHGCEEAKTWIERAKHLDNSQENMEIIEQGSKLLLGQLVKTKSKKKVCAFCNAVEKLPQKLKHCSRCKITFYCSLEHQQMDWNIHKTKCKEIRKKWKSNKKSQFETCIKAEAFAEDLQSKSEGLLSPTIQIQYGKTDQ